VNARIRHQVRLELCQIDIQGTIKPKRGGDRRNYLTNQTVEIGVRWPLYVHITSADVIDGFIVDHEGAVGVLEGGVCSEHRVVWLYY